MRHANVLIPSPTRRRRGGAPLVIAVATTVLAGALAPGAAAAAPNVLTLPPGASAYGKPYGGWSAAWWTWALSQPAATNPLFDGTGAQCANEQRGPVWFLAGGFGTGIQRTCAVPAGKALFFPVLNIAYCSFPSDPPEEQKEAFVRGVADPIAAGATGLHAAVDGVPVANLQDRFFVRSAVFGLTLGPDNVFGLPDGQVLNPCADAGYYLLLPPPAPGSHTITFGGTFPDFGGPGLDFEVGVTYALTVG